MLSCAERAIAFEKLIMELCRQRWDGSYVYKASSLCAFRQKAVGRGTRPSALGMSDPVLEFLEISRNYNQFSFLEHVYVALMMR